MFPEVSKGHADVVKIEDLKTGRLSLHYPGWAPSNDSGP